jgi:hypothetical protein
LRTSCFTFERERSRFRRGEMAVVACHLRISIEKRRLDHHHVGIADVFGRAAVIDPSSLARIVGPVPDSLPEVRPAAILLMPARPDLAAVVEQALTDVLPDCMRPEQLHCVEPLDLDTAEASIALDPEQFAGDL